MATMNISLPDALKDWVETMVATGRYANASDYVRDLIRKDEALRAPKLAAMRALVQEALEGGPAEVWDAEAFLAERHAAKKTAAE